MTSTLDFSRRYVRQIVLPEVGEAGQQKLAQAKVLVVGAGGLGGPLISYLASCGVGHLGIIDGDRVELSNLPRQILFESGDIGRLKVEAASDRVVELNPECEVTAYPFVLDADNAHEIISKYDVVADGCDRFAARFAVNEVCVALSKPLVSAAVSGFSGQVMTIFSPPPNLPSVGRGTACYRCVVHPDAADDRACNVGILAPFAGLVGSAQALEVVRMILGFPALVGRMAIIDGMTGAQRIVEVPRDLDCPVCGHFTAK